MRYKSQLILTIIVFTCLLGCSKQNQYSLDNDQDDASLNTLYATPTKNEYYSTEEILLYEENSMVAGLQSDNCFSHTINFENNLYGSLILYNYGLHDARIVLLNSGIQENLGILSYQMAVSPDNRKIAYVSENPQLLNIIDGYGNVLSEIPIKSMWSGVISWINEDNLLIEERSDNQSLNSKTIIYNVLDDTWFSLDEIPSLFSYAGIQWDNYKNTNIIISPDLERMIFPGPTKHGYPEIILFNNLNSEVLFAKYGIPDLVTPVWTMDGEFVFLGLYPKITDSDGENVINNEIDNLSYYGGYDLFKLNKNGQIIDRLTYFSTEQSTNEEKVSLSNNETKIAFWVSRQNNNGESEITNELAILDLETREVILTCMTITGYGPGQIHWSPDDQFLAVNYLVTNNVKGIILVDIVNQELMRFGWKNEEVKGWLNLN